MGNKSCILVELKNSELFSLTPLELMTLKVSNLYFELFRT